MKSQREVTGSTSVGLRNREAQLERLARYIARSPLAMDSIRRCDDGSLEIGTPPDPRTGLTEPKKS